MPPSSVPSLPAPVSSRSESEREVKSLRSTVTLPPAKIRSSPLKRTRSPTITYGSAGFPPESVGKYLIVGRPVEYISRVSRTPFTTRM